MISQVIVRMRHLMTKNIMSSHYIYKDDAITFFDNNSRHCSFCQFQSGHAIENLPVVY